MEGQPQDTFVSGEEETRQQPVSYEASETSETPETPGTPDHVAEKREHIRRACAARDLGALVSYATSEGGLLNDELRRSACT